MLKVLPCGKVEDRERAHFLFGVVRELTEQLITVNESTTHRRNRHSNTARIEDETIIIRVHLVGIRRRGSFLHSFGSALVAARLHEGRLRWHASKVTKGPHAVLSCDMSDGLCRLSSVSPTTNELHLLNQLVTVAEKGQSTTSETTISAILQ